MPDTRWNTSAGVYSSEAPKIAFYAATNRELVSAAQLCSGMKVVDLACGAGMTAQTVLELAGDQVSIYCVDIAEGMLKHARNCIKSSAVSFIHASAGSFARHLPGMVDRVLCNAAFWHFPNPDAVLSEVGSVLNPRTGQFLFNIPDQEFEFGDGTISEMAQVAASLLEPSAADDDGERPKFSYDRICRLASENGFGVADFNVLDIPLGREDLARFYSIPHVSARRFPELPEDRRTIAVRNAFESLDVGLRITYRWAQFILEKM